MPTTATPHAIPSFSARSFNHAGHAADLGTVSRIYFKEPIMARTRISGRIVRASSLCERRVLKRMGVDYLRVPRCSNPFVVARMLRRAAGFGPELNLLRRCVDTRPFSPQSETPPPVQLPHVTSEPEAAE